MLVIFASRFDRDAQAFADRWSAYDATLLTCEDLSVSGWRYYSNASMPSNAIIGGHPVSEEEITGVLTRWPAIHESELMNIAGDDREYVAAEMTAFLCSWLTRLKCPVLNRPTASTLYGPAWRPEQWIRAGAQLGIPVRRVSRGTGLSTKSSEAKDQPASTTVTVVGDRYFGTGDPVLGQHARRLAIAAGVDLLAVHFDCSEPEATLLSADLMPDLSDLEVSHAVLGYLLRKTVIPVSSQDVE